MQRTTSRFTFECTVILLCSDFVTLVNYSRGHPRGVVLSINIFQSAAITKKIHFTAKSCIHFIPKKQLQHPFGIKPLCPGRVLISVRTEAECPDKQHCQLRAKTGRCFQW